jgi:hypothetical protein
LVSLWRTLKKFRVPQERETRLIPLALHVCLGYNSDMTNEEVESFYKELEEFFGDSLANFEHYPKQFANQVKVYRYYKEKQNESSSVQ